MFITAIAFVNMTYEQYYRKVNHAPVSTCGSDRVQIMSTKDWCPRPESNRYAPSRVSGGF